MGTEDGKSQKGNNAAGDLEDLYAPNAGGGGGGGGSSGGRGSGGGEPRNVVGAGVRQPSRGARSRKHNTAKPNADPAAAPGPGGGAKAQVCLVAGGSGATAATWLPVAIAALGTAFVLFRLLASAGDSGDGADDEL